MNGIRGVSTRPTLWAVWLITQESSTHRPGSQRLAPTLTALGAAPRRNRAPCGSIHSLAGPGPAPHSLLGLRAASLTPTNQAGHQEGTRPALASRSVTEGAGGRCSSQWRAEPAEPSGGGHLGNGEKTGPFGLCCENSYPSMKPSPVPRALDAPPSGQAVRHPGPRPP